MRWRLPPHKKKHFQQKPLLVLFFYAISDMRKNARKKRQQILPHEPREANAPVGFRNQKLLLACSIMLAGMAIALGWHGYQGWILDLGYPHDTFLFNPQVRYTDYVNARNAAALPTPYASGLPDGYFPASYAVFYRIFTFLPQLEGFLVFTIVGLFAALFVSIYALHPIAAERLSAIRARALAKREARKQSAEAIRRSRQGHARQVIPRVTFPRIYVLSLGYALALLGLSCPLWFELDRANNELFIAVLIATSLIYIGQARYGLGFAWLLPGICFKLYPAALLVLFLRRGKLRYILIAGLAFLLVNWLSLISFLEPISESLKLEHEALAKMFKLCVIGNWAMSGSASPWNAWKLIIQWSYYHGDGSDQSFDQNRADLGPFFEACMPYFTSCCILGAIAVTLYGALVEKEFLRRVVVILLFLVMGSPYGGDYKLLHVISALIAMLLIRKRRPFDLIIVALLAFTLIPKREMLLTSAGITDSGYRDVSVAIILNPLSMLLAIALLFWDGFKQWSPNWSMKRLRILLASFWIPLPGLPGQIAQPTSAKNSLRSAGGDI